MNKTKIEKTISMYGSDTILSFIDHRCSIGTPPKTCADLASFIPNSNGLYNILSIYSILVYSMYRYIIYIYICIVQEHWVKVNVSKLPKRSFHKGFVKEGATPIASPPRGSNFSARVKGHSQARFCEACENGRPKRHFNGCFWFP